MNFDIDRRWMLALAVVMGLTAFVAQISEWREIDHMRPYLPGFVAFFAYSAGWYACKVWGR